MAAVLDFKNKSVVISTDFDWRCHFDLAYMPLKHLGYKAVVVNIRYLCNECKGNSNHSFCRSIQPFSVGSSWNYLMELHIQYKIDVIGGDTTSSQKDWSFNT
jgi:thiamine-monophosphate kinase